MAYATTTEFTSYTGKAATADTGRLLQRASNLLDALIVVSYRVDALGVPYDLEVIDALKNATCAQVEWWIETGDPIEGSSRFETTGLSAGTGGLNLGKSRRRLAPQAEDELRKANLLSRSVQ